MPNWLLYVIAWLSIGGLAATVSLLACSIHDYFHSHDLSVHVEIDWDEDEWVWPEKHVGPPGRTHLGKRAA